MSKTTEATAVAVKAPAELSTRRESELGNNLDSHDIDIPRMNIVQKTSEIDAEYGSVVVDKKHTLLELDQIGEAAVVSAAKGWREDIPYDDEGIPRMAFTQDESDAIASQSEYDMIEFAEITLLIKQPDGASEEAYPFPIGDHQYSIGKINVAKDAYRQTFKRLATFAAFNRSVPIHTRIWSFAANTLSRGKYTWVAPSLTVTNAAPPAAVTEFLETFAR